MNYTITITALIFTFVLCKCDSQSELSDTQVTEVSEMINEYQDNETVFKNVLLTSRSSFAGVQSNLKGTRKYELKMDVVLNQGIEFKRLLIDSVAVPFSALVVNGDKVPKMSVDASTNLITLTAYRHIYSSDPNVPQMTEEVIYEDSGLMLGKGAVLEYIKDQKPYYLQIEEIKLMQNIYAP